MNWRQRVLVIITVVGTALALAGAVLLVGSYVSSRRITDRRLTHLSDYLVDCTTPTPSTLVPGEPPHPAHECYERAQRGQSGAIVEIDCRARRMQARLPAPPDPRKPCIDQTPADVYPGVAGSPPRG